MRNILARQQYEQTFAERQLEFSSILQRLNEKKYSGRLLVSGKPRGTSINRVTWTFFFDYGRVLFVKGGLHPVRHWQSLLQRHTQSNIYQSILRSLPSISVTPETLCWEFEVLKANLKDETLSRQEFTGIVKDAIVEAIFDILHLTNIHFDISNEDLSQLSSIVFIDPSQALEDAKKEWLIWYKTDILNCHPDRAVTIESPKALQDETSAAAYKAMTAMLDGQSSIREIAAKANKDVKIVARSLMPLINTGVLALKDIPDLPCPVKIPGSSNGQVESIGAKYTIACIDDSPLICDQMHRLVTTAGYDYFSIDNPLRAIVTLLRRKPDLIFLDLVMPHTNGYEICSQLRKIHHFQDIPIIILTGNDGIIDRFRASLVGCTDFLSKPLTASTLQTVLENHLVERIGTGQTRP